MGNKCGKMKRWYFLRIIWSTQKRKKIASRVGLSSLSAERSEGRDTSKTDVKLRLPETCFLAIAMGMRVLTITFLESFQLSMLSHRCESRRRNAPTQKKLLYFEFDWVWVFKMLISMNFVFKVFSMLPPTSYFAEIPSTASASVFKRNPLSANK